PRERRGAGRARGMVALVPERRRGKPAGDAPARHRPAQAPPAPAQEAAPVGYAFLPARAGVTLAYVGIGSNLDEPVAQVRSAFDELASIRDTRLVARSALYRSAPQGYADQPDFINAVAALDTGLG